LLDKYYYSYPPVTVNYVYFPSNFFIAGEQTIIVYYSPTIRNVYDNKLAYGLFGGDKVGYVDFNNGSYIEFNTPNTTTLVLQRLSEVIYYQDENYYGRNYQIIIINIDFIKNNF
jgi:hypothetical protein